jgi:hypothetical protein
MAAALAGTTKEEKTPGNVAGPGKVYKSIDDTMFK